MAKKDNLVYTILVEFKDKFDHSIVYKIGEEHAFDAGRAKSLVDSGLIEIKKK